MSGSPAYRFPAEWEPQEAIWFAWPARDDLWPGHIGPIRDQLAALYRLAARYQPVRVLCPAEAQKDLRERLDGAPVELFDYRTDDVWIRDFGPLFLLPRAPEEPMAVADWRFDAWGGKFPQHRRDDEATAWLAAQLGLHCRSQEAVLEGGAVESNGAGRLLTTEAVLLNPNRNGDLDRAANETLLREGLGVEEVIWLGEGLVGDDTDGHIDNLARFFREDAVLLAAPASESDANAPALAENRRRLERYRSPAGTSLDIVPLPLPEPVLDAGEPMAASYLNFVILNGAVLVPTYRQPAADSRALAILGECFPEREVLGVDCLEIIREGGALHCMSQHQPRMA